MASRDTRGGPQGRNGAATVPPGTRVYAVGDCHGCLEALRGLRAAIVGDAARADAEAPRADLRQGDAAALQFDDDSFDLGVCNFGMMRLPDQPKALTEICRVLRPGAQFIMATWRLL